VSQVTVLGCVLANLSSCQSQKLMLLAFLWARKVYWATSILLA